jgi:hypothetical protein
MGKNGFDCGNQLEHKVVVSRVLEAGAGHVGLGKGLDPSVWFMRPYPSARENGKMVNEEALEQQKSPWTFDSVEGR